MEPEFWRTAWTEGRIGFHEGKPNGFLEQHWQRLGSPGRVLVPLCGKTEDLLFLRDHGFGVVGVELSERAVRAFFSEHGLEPTTHPAGALTRFEAAGITLYAGDFFATTAPLLGPLTGLYDRAAVIALPLPLRERYAAHLLTLLPPGTEGLIVTVEYPQERMNGPPFSVPEAELRRLYPEATVEPVGAGPVVGMGRLATADFPSSEHCYAVRFRDRINS